MRDIALTLVIAVLLAMVVKHPVVGAYLWAWLSMMSPHKLSFGFAYSFPFAQLTAVVTLLAVLLTRKRQAVPSSPALVAWLLLFLWMSVTSLGALGSSEEVLERWVFVLKIQVMLFVTLLLVRTAAEIRILVWVVALSIAFYGIKGGVWTVLTGGGERVWGPPGGLIQGNNELAVALIMVLPFLYWLRQTSRDQRVRWMLAFAMVTCAFSILGSQSRGALLALVAMSLFLGLKSRHPVGMTLVTVSLVMVVIAFMPESWTSRMETIKDYTQDGSAMSRIWTWQTMWNAAVDRPFFGAGFRADNLTVFSRYSPTGPEWKAFEGAVFVAHSIYFQMLGEHGFVGLALFMLLWLITWRQAGRAARLASRFEDLNAWLPLLMRMTQVSLIGYGAGGAFLSLAYFDLPYYLFGFVALCDRLVRLRAGEGTATATASAPANLSDAARGSDPNRLPAP